MREFVYYRHPGPRRAWKVGSEPAFLTSLRSLRSRDQKRRCCCYLRYFSVREVPKWGLPPNGTPHGPPGAQGAPNGPQRCPKTANGSPKAGQRGPKSTQREPKGDQSRPKSVPMGSQRWPKTAKGSPGGPNYINKLPINRPSGRYVIK